MDELSIIKFYNDGINAVVSLVKDFSGQILSLAKQVDMLNQKITKLEARLNGLTLLIIWTTKFIVKIH